MTTTATPELIHLDPNAIEIELSVQGNGCSRRSR
jgi:hypothetical protein